MDLTDIDRWNRTDHLFAEALELPANERASFLERSCGGDEALLRSVRMLLDSAAEAERAIGESATAYAAHLLPSLRDDSDAAELPPGGRIGPYRVLAAIGRGGMGAVYMAERADGEFEKRVALKLVKRGMDTDEILRRFRHERGILASLEHPHIARLYDGGATADGRPYLVMELIDGLPVTTWCDTRRLGIDARLRLFRTVCEAVQHAHQNLIVHRDIKPSNILVCADGTPRLLDFGIAKLLDADPATAEPDTRIGLRLFTPEYAAPEQLRGDPVTAATDVHGLGAVLYELLTGRRPFDAPASDPVDASAFVREPARPSTAVRPTPADGGSAAGHDPAAVAAARSTTTERLRRRLAGDLDNILLRALEPRPDLRYASVQQLMDDIGRHVDGLPIHARAPSPGYRALKFVRRRAIPLVTASLVALSLIGGTVMTTMQARQAALERDSAEYERARAEQVTGFLVDLFETADPTGLRDGRGDTLRVRAVLDRGADRLRDDLAGRPALRGELLATLGRIYTNLGAYQPAEALLRDALALTHAVDGEPATRATRLALLARVATEKGEFPRADSLYGVATASLAAARTAPDSMYAALLSEHGLIRSYLGDYEGALALNERALAHVDRVAAGARPLRSRVLNNLAIVRYDLGEYAEAESLFREALETERLHLRPDHPSLATTLNNVASSVHYQGRYDEAEPLYMQAIAIGRRALGEAHPSPADFVQNLATLYDDQQRYDAALPLYRDAVRAYEAAFGRGSARTAMLLRNLGLNRYAAGAHDEAGSLLREVERTLTDELGSDHLYTVLASVALARVLTATGSMDEAFARLSAGLPELERTLPSDHHLIATTRRDLGAWYAARREFEQAEPLLLEAHAALVASRGENHSLAVETRDQLQRLYLAWERPDPSQLTHVAAPQPE